MRLNILFLGLGLLLASPSFCQEETKKDTSWKLSAVAGVNFSQVYLDNWAAGGVNSLSATGLFNAKANFSRNKSTWDNNLDLAYGLIRQGDYFDDEVLTTKSDDRIELSSKYGRSAFKSWYYSGLASFRSQFAPGFNTPGDSLKISDWLAPGYLVLAVGMDYKPNSNFTLFLSPVTGKVTFVTDPYLSSIGAFGVEEGQTVRNEYGGYLKLAFSKKFEAEALENLSFSTKIDLFSNYVNNPQNIDVNWETLLAMKVNKYISCSLSTQLIYDDDVQIDVVDDLGIAYKGPRTQFKQVFGLGISYQF